MQKPNITTAQILALIQAAVATAIAFGLSLSEPQQVALLGLAAAVGATLNLGDAVIRNGRSRILAPPAQNITVLDPAAAGLATAEPAEADKVHDAGDEGIDNETDGLSDVPPAGQ